MIAPGHDMDEEKEEEEEEEEDPWAYRADLPRSVRDCVRCSGYTAMGTQCSRTTCKYSDYCWQHAKRYVGLKIGDSTIQAADQGLFVTRPFNKDDVVARYDGEWIPRTVWDRHEGDYGADWDDDTVIDARSTQASYGRWPNDCREGDNCGGNNLRWSKYYGNRRRGIPPRLTLKAKRDLNAGEEVYVDYGATYWRDDE